MWFYSYSSTNMWIWFLLLLLHRKMRLEMSRGTVPSPFMCFKVVKRFIRVKMWCFFGIFVPIVKVYCSDCMVLQTDSHLGRPRPASGSRSSPCIDCGHSQMRCGCTRPGRRPRAPPRRPRLLAARGRPRASSRRFRLRSSSELPGGKHRL